MPTTATTATAQQLRARSIKVPVPGTELVIECRCPELLDEVANNWLPLDRFADVIASIGQWSQAATIGELTTQAAADIRKNPDRFAEFIDRWVCVAAVGPKIVLERERAAADESLLWIDDVDYDVKLAILRSTNRSLVARSAAAAVTEFRGQQPDGGGDRAGGAVVRQ